MKKIILSLGIMLASSALFAQELQVDKEEHDFGTLKQGADATCYFTITNVGVAPLIISNCDGSCGCTVPECPKMPIAPGASAKIAVKYDSMRLGAIRKEVYVNYMDGKKQMQKKVLRIKGEISKS
jgi:hypothetical protein